MEPRRATNGGIAYDLTTPLFTDYASKYRFIFVPEGKQVAYSTLDAIDTAPDWEDTAIALESRAKAYLDINCAHCHNPTGFASNSALFLEFWRKVDTAYGICKTPVAAGSGSGGLNHDIVPGDADSSILAYRMDSNEPDVRMPEIGRTMVHDEGVELVREWISSLSGSCQ